MRAECLLFKGVGSWGKVFSKGVGRVQGRCEDVGRDVRGYSRVSGLHQENMANAATTCRTHVTSLHGCMAMSYSASTSHISNCQQ